MLRQATLFLFTLTMIMSMVTVEFSLQQQLGSDAIHLSQVKALTLHKGKYTAGRRTRPIPQLNCIGKPDYYEPETVQCINQGGDGNTFSWKCESSLKDGYKFGKLNVNCEGYRYSGDEYVLKGSCALEYTLERTGTQNTRQNNHDQHRQHRQQQQYGHETTTPSNPSSLGVFGIVLIVLVVVVFIWISKQISGTATNSSRPSTRAYQQPRTYDSHMYPDINPNYVEPNTTTNESAFSGSSIPSFVAGGVAGYAAASMFNKSTNQTSYGNGSYFNDNNNSNPYHNNTSSRGSYFNDNYSSSSSDNSESTAVGYAETTSR